MSGEARNLHPRAAGEALDVLRGVLGESLLGVYLFGSAVVGGLRPDSDVDILAVVKESLPDEARRRLATKLMAISGRSGDPVSRPIELTVMKLSEAVPWRYPPQSEFVYGEWLREILKERPGARPGPDADLAILLTKVRESSIPMLGPNASDLLDPVPISDVRRAFADTLPALIANIEADERNVVLTLSRMWMTAVTGEIQPKDAAAEWAIARLPAEHAPLVELARDAYRGEVPDDWKGRGAELSALVQYMRAAIDESLRESARAH